MNLPTIFIIIDALGYVLADRHGFAPDGLPERIRLRSVPGFSQSALTSIFTGKVPDRHGLWMMYSFAEGNSPFRWLSLLPAGLTTRKLWLRRLIDWKLRRVDGIKSYYSLYNVPREVLEYLDLPSRENLFMPSGGGNNRTIIDELIERGAKLFIRDYHTPEEEAFYQLEEALRARRHDYFILYTASLDALMHRRGPMDDSVASRLRWYENRIERILSASSDARVVVLGDHGMCGVFRSVDIMEKISDLNLRIPHDYIPFYDSTMARFKICSQRAETAITEVLSTISQGRILGGMEKKELGIDFDDGKFGDIIYIVDGGTVILPSHMGCEMVLGMHGYHPDLECMYSCMLTNLSLGKEELSVSDLAELLVPGFIPGI